MRRPGMALVLLAAGMIPVQPASVMAKEGSAHVKIGYVYTDEEGARTVNQETFNLYEGLNVSIADFRYVLDNGFTLRGALTNLSLENRNLDFSVSQPQRLSLSVYDNKYRRIYDANAALATKRERTGVRASVTPVKHAKVFGGYDRTTKAGRQLFTFEELSTPALFLTDYAHETFNIGAEGFYRGGRLRLEYGGSSFEDEARTDGDREAKIVRLSGAAPVPGLSRVVLSGGYDHRKDELRGAATELETKLGWGATKVHLPKQVTADYRFVLARTLHTGTQLETDNVLNTVSVGKTWNRRGGMRLGYESRIADDLVDRSESHGFLVDGWFNHADRVFVRAHASTRGKDVVTGSTFLGDEDVTRLQASVRYADDRFGDVSVRYQARSREHPGLGTQVDYTALATQFNLVRKEYGRLTFGYAYTLGDFQNRAGGFAFEDHVITGTVTPVPYKNLALSGGGAYYRSMRDVDVEKFGVHVSADYALPHDLGLQLKYSAFNYDDLRLIGAYYTGNVVELSVLKRFSL